MRWRKEFSKPEESILFTPKFTFFETKKLNPIMSKNIGWWFKKQHLEMNFTVFLQINYS